MKRLKAIASLLLLAITVLTLPARAAEFDPKEIIFDHLGDGYGWEVPFDHHHRIPLPVIVRDSSGDWHCFSSAHLDHNAVYNDGDVTWQVPSEGDNKGKVVEIMPDGAQYRPLDFSITKNVMALFISVAVVLLVCMPVARWHRRHGFKAPRKFTGAVESLIDFIYRGVIKPTLKQDARRFAPFLLTIFMFIFVMNLMGLIVIFPGGANLTGNIAVTLVLALLTFFITNLFATQALLERDLLA